MRDDTQCTLTPAMMKLLSPIPSLYKIPFVMPDDLANTAQIYNTSKVVANSSGRNTNAAAIAIKDQRNRTIVWSRAALRGGP